MAPQNDEVIDDEFGPQSIDQEEPELGIVGVELVGITRVCPLTENQQKFGQRHIEQGRVYWLRDEQAIDAGKIETLPLSKRLQHAAYVRTLGTTMSALDFVSTDIGFEVERPITTGDLNHAKIGGNLSAKSLALHRYLDRVRVPWHRGHQEVTIDRQAALESARDAMGNWSANQWRQTVRFRFLGEPAVDAGGVAREFWALISHIIFDPDRFLFMPCDSDQLTYQFNPYSTMFVDQSMAWYSFVGKLMGKALLDRQNIEAHFDVPLLKHITGRPIQFEDLQSCDEEIFSSMLKMTELTDDMVAACELDFTITSNFFGVTKSVPLKPNGHEVAVTSENLFEFLCLRFRERVFGRVQTQLEAFLTGFYFVVPMKALLPITAWELELILCGLPAIHIPDWIDNTRYTGSYEARGRDHPVISWFWEVLQTFDEEKQVKILQFATGTSRLPVQGFAGLQGRDGNLQPFTITSIAKEQSVFPRAHTCFNRVDLPLYDSREELAFYMGEILAMESYGFSME